MIFQQEQIHEAKGVTYHLIPTKKFKTIAITAKLKTPLNRDTVTKRALLPYILKQGTESYPSRQEIQLKLDELYGARLSITSAKRGENHILTFYMEMANEQFVPNNEAIFDEGIELFNELLFKPHTKNGSFDETVFNREKETLKSKMQSVIDDKMKYANQRLIEEMCENEAYQLPVQGFQEDLEKMKPEDLYSYYKKMLTEDKLDIYIVGDIDPDEIQEKAASVLSGTVKNETVQTPENREKQILEAKEIIEQQDVLQAKLHLGYRTNTTYQDLDYPALQVFNGLFGGFPNSKLFINVREKNSLAYYAASRIESHKGLLFVFSGIASENYEKAKDIIQEQMDALKNGDFTEKELEETKDLLVNQLLETMDSSRGIVELFYQQVVGGKKLSPNELIDQIKQVTKEDIVRVANKITEDTIYLLTNKGGDQHE